MKHDPFEEELKELPWRGPSDQLGERIALEARQREGSIVQVFFRQPIALGRVAALILCAGVIGFALGKIGNDGGVEGVYLGQTELRIIETGVSGNFFDMGESGHDMLPGALEFEVQQTEEVGI